MFDIIPCYPCTLFGLSNSSGCSMLLFKHFYFPSHHTPFFFFFFLRVFLVEELANHVSQSSLIIYVFDSQAGFHYLGSLCSWLLCTRFYIWMHPAYLFISIHRLNPSSTNEDILFQSWIPPPMGIKGTGYFSVEKQELQTIYTSIYWLLAQCVQYDCAIS